MVFKFLENNRASQKRDDYGRNCLSAECHLDVNPLRNRWSISSTLRDPEQNLIWVLDNDSE